MEQYGTGEAYLPWFDALGALLDSPHRERILSALRVSAPTWCLQLPSAFASSGIQEQLLRETIVCALNVRYPHKTYVLDDGCRGSVEALARELGADYIARKERDHAKAGNLNNALRITQGEFVITLDADHVPSPEFIDELIGFFADDQMAIVQTHQDFYNLDSFQHLLNVKKGYGWQQQELFFNVIQPGKDHYNAAFYCGSPAMIRRAALDDIGGFATGDIVWSTWTWMNFRSPNSSSGPCGIRN